MSYAPYQRNTSGIVFFGEQGNQPTFYSDTNFLVQDGAAGYIKAPNLIIGDGGNVGSVTDPDSIAIASNGNVTMSQSLSITGNLTVNGTTTTVNSTVVTIEDPMIILGAQSANTNPYGSTADDNKDRGIAFAWNKGGGGSVIGFFGHDDSIQGFTYIPSGSVSSDVFSGPVGWGVFAGISGALAGNADTATEATNVTATANNTTNETVYLTFVDGATGTQGIETDTSLTYNPSTNILTAGTFSGNTVDRYIGASGHATGSGIFNASADQVPNIELQNAAILGQTSEATPDSADQILIYDDTAGALRRMTRGNFISGLGGFSNFDVTDSGNVARQVDDGEVVKFINGVAVTFQVTSDGTTHSVSGNIPNNAVTETHLNTSVAGNGLAGGGGTALSVDISEFSDGVMNSGDKFLSLHNDGSTENLISISQLGSWLAGTNITTSGDGRLSVNGGFSSFDITGDTGTETVDDGETVTFVGSAGLDVAVTATNTVTYTVDISEYSTAAVAISDSFMMLDSDGTTEQRSTVQQLGTYLAGDNITNTSGVLSVADSDIEAAIFTAANFVDGTTIDFTVSAGVSVTAEVIDNTITELKRSRSVVTDSTTSTLASTDDVSLVDATSGAVTITLTGVSTSGKRLTIKKTDSTANAVTIQRDGLATIDGALTKILYSQYESITIISDGSKWHII